MVYVLGVNQNHDASAALLRNGEIVSAIAAERITRVKHTHLNALVAVKYVLRSEGIEIDEVDLVVECNHHEQSDGGPGLNELSFYLKRARQYYIHNSHHELHAASTFYSSPFKEADVFVVDGKGSSIRGARSLTSNIPYFECESIYKGNKNGLKLISQNATTHLTNFPEAEDIGIGRYYNYACKTVFDSRNDAGKLMALASYGDPEKVPSFLKLDKDVLSIETIRAIKYFSEARGDFYSKRNIAARVQQDLERYLLNFSKSLDKKASFACFAGGTFLNCPTNRKIEEAGEYKNFWFFPASTDDGIAIGAAFYGYYSILGFTLSNNSFSPYLGRAYSNEEVAKELELFKNMGMPATYLLTSSEEELCDITSGLLSSGYIIGWFQGGAEFGPRALGNRSILADPRDIVSRERINHEIKKREWFRPVAPAVEAMSMGDFFDRSQTLADRWMLSTAKVSPELSNLLPAISHVDGTARVQSVSAKINAIFSKLIEAFREKTGFPILVNTSFNSPGEPIVESPKHAINTFMSTSLDAVVINNIVVVKDL